MPTKTALLIDFDNVFTSLWRLDREAAVRFASEAGDWLQVLANTHLTGESRRWLVAKCYLNPAGYVPSGDGRAERMYFSQFRPSLVRAGFEVVDCPAVTRQGKNAADIRMVLDAIDLLNHRTRFDEFVLASGDADFTPLLQRIRADDRRITVASPGYLASAYTAVADRIVNFEALARMLNGDAEESAPEDLRLASKQVAAPGSDPDEQARFADFIRRRFHDANSPLNLAALASEAARLYPTAKQSEWFGRRTFSAAMAALNLPNLKTSSYHMWDDERHQPPTDSLLTTNFNVPEPVAQLMRDLDLPRIEQKDWPVVFCALSSYATRHSFKFYDAARLTRDALAAEHGIQIARASLTYVVRNCMSGGVRFDGDVAPTADQIADGFFNALLDRAASLGIQVTPEAEETIIDWLGLAPLETC